MQLKVLNFEEFNPRKDRKKHVWFRVENTIVFSKKLHKLDPDQKWLWVCILSLCSFEQRDWIDVDFDYLAKVSEVSEKKIKLAISHFEKNEMIQLVQDAVTDRLPDGYQTVPIGNPTDRQTDVTDRQTEIISSEAPKCSEVVHEQLQDILTYDFLKKVSLKVQESWLATYEPEWVQFQLKESVNWMLANPSKKPKSDFAKFFNSWLSRSWEWKRKNNQSEPSNVRRFSRARDLE